jgi:hypothetical protein
MTTLKRMVAEHEAMRLLDASFGEGLKRAPLPREVLKRFIACHVAGVRDVPTSILSVALRLSHACMKHDYFGAHAIAARTLFAAVHEYGLQNTEAGIAKTHFELYRDAIRSWGFDEKEILADPGIFPESFRVADYNEGVAQAGPLGKALGGHIALEATADREFFLLWEGFARHWEAYGLRGTDDPALGFYHIHIVQEPQHENMSYEALQRYLELVPSDAPLVVEGCAEFLDVYCAWIKAFHRTFFC